MNDYAYNKLASAMLECKSVPNILQVEEAFLDNSVVKVSENKMKELQWVVRSKVFLESVQTNKPKKTICYIYTDETCSDDKIKMNQVVMKNLGVRPNEAVLVRPCLFILSGKLVRILPIIHAGEKIEGDLYRTYLQPYFVKHFRPLSKGDKFAVRGPMKIREFKVIETDPSPYCIVSRKTVIDCSGTPIIQGEE